MSEWRPRVGGMPLRIGSAAFDFMPHPLFPNDNDAVFVLEGGEALIYQMQDISTKKLYALKVIKPAYRSEHIARVTNMLQHYAHITGLYMPYRTCLTKEKYPDLIKACPELEYAVLVSWLKGRTWAGFMLDQEASVQYTLQAAYKLASMVAQLLENLELNRLAHADIAGGNVFLSRNLRHIQLLDLEGMYFSDTPIPQLCSQGSPGYQHRNLGPQGQCCPEGDRFAGAILLTEILTWWNPRVRAHVADYAESLFQPAELQVDGSLCWLEVRNTLWSIRPDLLYLFDQAWSSSTLSECPTFTSWSMTLLSSFV